MSICFNLEVPYFYPNSFDKYSVIENSLQCATPFLELQHTAYSRNNMGRKCEGNYGLWVLNEMIKKIYISWKFEKIVGAVWKLPANPAQFECKWAGLAVLFSR